MNPISTIGKLTVVVLFVVFTIGCSGDDDSDDSASGSCPGNVTAYLEVNSATAGSFNSTGVEVALAGASGNDGAADPRFIVTLGFTKDNQVYTVSFSFKGDIEVGVYSGDEDDLELAQVMYGSNDVYGDPGDFVLTIESLGPKQYVAGSDFVIRKITGSFEGDFINFSLENAAISGEFCVNL